jgi:hypothetical protein
MSDPDARLTAALRADAPPARDVKFRVETLVRLEQARFRRQVRRAGAAVSLVALLAVVNAPAIEAWMAVDVQRLWIVTIGAVAALFALAVVPFASSPGVRSAVGALGRWLYL